MRVCTELFFMGLMLGWGPCLAFCTPIVIPCVAGSRRGWLEAFKGILAFSFARIGAYGVLGLLAALLGGLARERFYSERWEWTIWIFGILFVLILGILLVLGKEPRFRLCHVLRRAMVDSPIKSMTFLGIVVGILPCAPLLGILAYIAYLSKSALAGAFWGLSFGLGTASSPLIIFGTLAGGLPGTLIRSPRIYSIFSRLCGLFLIGFAIQMMIKVV